MKEDLPWLLRLVVMLVQHLWFWEGEKNIKGMKELEVWRFVCLDEHLSFYGFMLFARMAATDSSKVYLFMQRTATLVPVAIL